MEKFFKLKENGTNVKTEFMAGLTTFFAMVYILMVNANMFANPFGDGTPVLGVSYGAIYIATAISAIIGTVLIGLLANLPLAQASGMGLNAFFVYTCCVGFGLTYANALVLVLMDGVVFILLTVTGLRKKIFTAIPDAVRKSIPAGIGLFIALGKWNDWYSSMLFIKTESKHTLQYYLYRMVNMSNAIKSMQQAGVSTDVKLPSETLKMAMAIVATGPVVLVYPFVQRYFVKGLTVGAVKG